MTPAYIDKLWERIEDLEEKLVANPDDRGVAILLDCALRNYEAKLRLYEQDSKTLAYVR